MGAVKSSLGASLAESELIGNYSFSQAVIGTRNYVENALLGSANYVRVVRLAVVSR